MGLFDALPTELVLVIISYLPLQSIHTLCVLNREAREFIHDHSSCIYHSAAVLHGFASSHCDLNDAINDGQWETSWLQNCSTWKQLCYRHVELEKAWNGRRTVVHWRSPEDANPSVWRLKIDELERTVITTSEQGGLYVSCVDTRRLLWSLPDTYVRRWAHLEYSNGFMVFGQTTNHLEVWRRSTDTEDRDLDPCRPTPDISQLRYAPNSEQTGRGVYQPYALLPLSEQIRAFRFVFPHLLVASWEATAFVFDIPTATLIQSIPIPGPSLIKYVEINADHIFVCRENGLYAFTRSNGSLAFRLPQDLADERSESPGEEPLESVSYHPRSPTPILGVDPSSSSNLSSRPLDNPTSDLLEVASQSLREGLSFTAVHIAPGNNPSFVATTGQGYLFYVRGMLPWDSKTVTSTAEKLRRGTTIYNLGTAITNMAFDGRRIVCSTLLGVYIINLPSDNWDGRIRTKSTLPATMQFIWRFHESNRLFDISCIQLSRTAIWLTWPSTPRQLYKSLHCVDFARSQDPELTPDYPMRRR